MKLKNIAVLFLVPLVLLPGCRKKEEGYFYESTRKGSAEAPVKEVPKDILTTQQAFINLVQAVKPAVVNISTVSKRKAVRPFFEFSPFFDDFFGDDMGPRYRRDKSLGSGFIINPEGYIVTNDHVVRDAETIQVRLDNDREYDAKLVGSDPKTDLAVLKISATEQLPHVVLGDSEKLQVGQWAIAIGNPFGLDKTVTVGVISATGRSNMGIETYEDFVQTDASINPGNSGGPLLNVYGEVIGINTAIVAAGQGIGFAIPVNMAKQVVAQLMKKGTVSRGWLGVSIQPLTRELAQSFGLKSTSSAVISEVLPGSPAAAGGLRQGDVILKLDGREVKDARRLQLLVAEIPAGKKVQAEIFRDGRTQVLSLTIGNSDSAEARRLPQEKAKANWLGMVVEEIPANSRGVTGGGVRVSALEPGGVAAEGGIEPGDVILAVNQKRISGLSDYLKAMKEAEKKGTAAFLVNRGGVSLYFAFTIR